MGAPLLDLNQRLRTAGALIVRARISLDIWWLYAAEDTRAVYHDAMDSYSEFFKFDEHAHFVSFIVQSVALLETKKDRIALPPLFNEVFAARKNTEVVAVRSLVTRTQSIGKKLAVLRHNLFAHRSGKLSYADAFKAAKVKPDDFHELSELSLAVANALLAARKLPKVHFAPLPLEDTARLLLALKPRSASGA